MNKYLKESGMELLWGKIRKVIFRAPERRKVSLVYFAIAALFLWMHLFLDSSLFNLVMSTGMSLTGLSEALPEDRNILAGSLRIAAILIYLSILGLSFLRPEVII
jgi:hypothetical protein